ncbi:zinc finger protein 358-like [Manduca sexta]|uniref:zinc finger protein 358-like n=1 Tax=Manduca sexta TaxID=7130 RepID=UPI00189006C2|nr:zinc finger protein 358-like [Manduca sexta]
MARARTERDVRLPQERPGRAAGGGSGTGADAPAHKPEERHHGPGEPAASNLKQHILNVHAAHHLAHSCPVCGKAFKTRQYMQIHMNSIHGVKQRRDPPAPALSADLYTHRAALAGGAALGYRPQCPLCGRVYSSTSNLRQHMLNVHSQTDRDQWFPCQHCGKCKTKHYLINHQLQKRRGARWHTRRGGGCRGRRVVAGGVGGARLQCPLCSLRLRSPGGARAHLAAHYPRDSPVCPVASCARHFAHPNSVRNHMRIKHRRQWENMKTLKWSCGGAN